MLQTLLDLSKPIDQLIFDFSRTLFTHTPVVMPDGRLFVVHSGVPSGSYWTQIIDSIVNLLLIYSFQLKYFGDIQPTYVLGDDSIFTSDSKPVPIEVITEYFAQFGLTLNSDKTVITKQISDVIFLGHNCYGSGVTRDEFMCAQLALYPSDTVLSPATSITRIASLLYDSGFNSTILHNIYRILLHLYELNWSQQPIRPLTITYPFSELFVIS